MDAAALDDLIRRLLDARGGRTARPAQLSDPEIRRLCAAAKDVFLGQPNLLELEAPIKVCGKEPPAPSTPQPPPAAPSARLSSVPSVSCVPRAFFPSDDEPRVRMPFPCFLIPSLLGVLAVRSY
jgi:hypothetical protein